ncbi:MAG: IPTL-CTERM sorting domain-containing protein, partial [Desulfuromusa sp.]|nr:IPTL-CTERM sorting domain-containing protein [Desulfuromusa sp.]
DIAVAPADQVIAPFSASPNFGFLGSTSTLSATASSGLVVTFGGSTPSICTVVNGTVSYLAVGTCTVTADQAGDANYNAAPQITLAINVTEFSPVSEPIPTLSQWSLVLLFLALLSMGGIVIRRKNTV